ncbi:MAG: ligase-associated DNA damage response DEXH box helicase [Flavobacteriales bacterium]|nr:ligase-associated DNA damage response DEXH box helicase [Flavobacteriales bacterium]
MTNSDASDARLLPVLNWFGAKKWTPFDFQREAWEAVLKGGDGIVNAPTGSGKTYSLLVPLIAEGLINKTSGKLRVIWIAPIRALAKEIEGAAKKLIEGVNSPWEVAIRTGDTSAEERKQLKKKMPEILITTPESLHVMFASKDYASVFNGLSTIVVDEWHELMGSKRGVQTELALSRLKNLSPQMRIWGISATIGNMDEALEVLLGNDRSHNAQIIRAEIIKKLSVVSLMPDEVETLPWAGHIGLRLIDKVAEVIFRHKSTLIFTNTRAQSEIWYHALLDKYPELAGAMGMHHSAVSKDLRHWVEDALAEGKLQAVVCTSSLDLGVDFRPVDAIVQIGGPKGVARFVQRAGRSGHQPGAESKIYFLPTHALELVEAAALRLAVVEGQMEERVPYIRSFDVLVQYLTTLAVSDGFYPEAILNEVRSTFSFQSMSDEEWGWCLRFITTGGKSLSAYPEYQKVVQLEGLFKVTNARIARRHRMSIGTIVSDQLMQVKYKRGGMLGHVEEYFGSSLREGDVFWFAGRALQVLQIKENTVQVVNSTQPKGKIPSWGGGRMPLSSKMSDVLKRKLSDFAKGKVDDVEMLKLAPLLELQGSRSALPTTDQLLIEQIQTDEGYHVFFYPFEGRLVHEGLASLIAYRISLLRPISFSLAFNDYGLELLSDQPIPLQDALDNNVLSPEYLVQDVEASINSAEMARRKFRDIAVISGLVFQGFPGKQIKDRHLQSSSSLVYDVFQDYDSDNLLLRQAFDEMIDHQLEINRFRRVLERIATQELVIVQPDKPTPLAFPIMVDRLRAGLTSESVDDRIAKMTLQYER